MNDFELSNHFTDEYRMDREGILCNLHFLNDELRALGMKGEVALVDGAVMCLVMNTRNSTRDIDAIFEPKTIIYECIRKVARKHSLSDDWLNDGAKGFISNNAEFIQHMELSNLMVLVASPEYMLAMKCLASRTDSESELDDIRNLILHLKIKSYEEVETIMLKYYPIQRFQIKTKYVIQEVLDGLCN